MNDKKYKTFGRTVLFFGLTLLAVFMFILLEWSGGSRVENRKQHCEFLKEQAVHSDVVFDGTWCLVNGVRIHAPGE